ncbi:hypothetical protein [Thalassobius sp. MITS945101]|uniref:hypothetical protein n=1 Tax=Thalassobius sp. MITS945101 TaxID=3096994 RepID=UPI00399A60A7
MKSMFTPLVIASLVLVAATAVNALSGAFPLSPLNADSGLAGAFAALALSACAFLVQQQRCTQTLRRPAKACYSARSADVSPIFNFHFYEVTK